MSDKKMSEANDEKYSCTCDLGHGVQSPYCGPCKVHNFFFPPKKMAVSDWIKKQKEIENEYNYYHGFDHYA